MYSKKTEKKQFFMSCPTPGQLISDAQKRAFLTKSPDFIPNPICFGQPIFPPCRENLTLGPLPILSQPVGDQLGYQPDFWAGAKYLMYGQHLLGSSYASLIP